CFFFLASDGPPFSIFGSFAKDPGLRFHIKIVVEAADLVDAMLVRDPDFTIHPAVSMDCNIQMSADDVLYSPPRVTEGLFDFPVDVIPGEATTTSQIPVKRS